MLESTLLRDRVLAEDTRELIARHFSTPGYDLDDVAKKLCVSRRTLQRALEPHDGFRTMLRVHRLQVAAGLLRETEAPVRSICRAVGYRQAAQFTKTFAKHFGVPPSVYRRNGS